MSEAGQLISGLGEGRESAGDKLPLPFTELGQE